MQKWDDYYKILQVHHLAEPEIIESAFKRLAKKYHPDVNSIKGSDLMMKQINVAYDVLKNPESRKKYDIEWLRRQAASFTIIKQTRDNSTAKKEYNINNINFAASAKKCLNQYFGAIKALKFEEAYSYLTNQDKKKISIQDFVKWQSAVMGVFKLQSFEITVNDFNKNVFLDGIRYTEVIDFNISTVEQNVVMDRIEKDIINKKMVMEKEGWRVYTGYQCIDPLIAKFENISRFLEAKNVVEEMAELYSNRDQKTGVFSKKGFIDIVEKEIWRNGRYGNVFSLMKLKLHRKKSFIIEDHKEVHQTDILSICKLLQKCLRKLDTIARWGHDEFVVLMPETNLEKSMRAAFKVKKAIEVSSLLPNRGQYITITIGVEEFKGSFDKTMQKLNQYTRTPSKNSMVSIVSELKKSD